MDKKTRSWTLAALGSAVLAGIVSYPLTSQSASAEREERKEVRHNPHIWEAIDALKHAKEEIETARHDFGGHKKEVVERVDRALESLDQIKDLER